MLCRFVLTRPLLYVCALLFLAMAGCTRPEDKTGSSTPQGQTGTRLSGPGIDFTRKSIGLPSETLDYAGTSAAALAGSKASGDVFFGESVQGDVKLYRRSLPSGTRDFITEIKQFHDGSLAATPDGKRLVYCRFRKLKEALDDPSVTFPDPIAVPYIYDVAAKQEQRAIDFNVPELRRWRANGMQPFISPDGKTVYVLAYDTDRMLFHKQTEEWLQREQRLRSNPATYNTEDRETDEKLVKDFVESQLVRDRLKEAGVSVEQGKPATEAIREAMRRFFEQSTSLQAALLVSRDGATTVLPLQFATGLENHYHFIAAAGNSAVVLAAQDIETEAVQEEPFFACDLASGALTRCGAVTGLTKLVSLSPDESELFVCYTPVDPAKKELTPVTMLRRIPLAGGPPTESSLGGDYLGVVDLDAAGKRLAGQDINDYNIYVVDTATGQRQLVSEQLAGLTGLLLSSDGGTLVYLDSGVTYKVDLTGDLEKKPGRITAEYFATYRVKIEAFLTGMGFTMPAGLESHWEEREGLGAHEVSVQYNLAGQPDKAALLRFDVARDKVVSLWFPGGYIFTAAPTVQGRDFDYFDAEKMARDILDRASWIPAAKRVLYQPGPNPLYDEKSDSYVVTFRESYQLANRTEQAFCNEATLRITGKTGQLAEMTLTSNEPVQDQPIKIERDRLDFIVKNLKDMPLPGEAPVTVAADKARLIVYTKRDQTLEGGKLVGKAQPRLCWEVDTLLQPDNDLIFTNVIDAETGEKLGSLSYMPMSPTATTTEH